MFSLLLLGNTFHCNCSMKWLQDSLWKSEWFTHETFGSWNEPECSFPVKGSLRTVNFCNVSTTESPTTQPTITLSTRRNNSTMSSLLTTDQSPSTSQSGTTFSSQLNNYTMSSPVTTDQSASKLQTDTTIFTIANNNNMSLPVTTDHSLSNFKLENSTANPSPDYPTWPVALLLTTCILVVAAISTAITVWLKISKQEKL